MHYDHFSSIGIHSATLSSPHSSEKKYLITSAFSELFPSAATCALSAFSLGTALIVNLLAPVTAGLPMPRITTAAWEVTPP